MAMRTGAMKKVCWKHNTCREINICWEHNTCRKNILVKTMETAMKTALLLMMRCNGAFLIEVKVDNLSLSQYTENIMFYKNILKNVQ